MINGYTLLLNLKYLLLREQSYLVDVNYFGDPFLLLRSKLTFPFGLESIIRCSFCVKKNWIKAQVTGLTLHSDNYSGVSSIWQCMVWSNGLIFPCCRHGLRDRDTHILMSKQCTVSQVHHCPFVFTPPFPTAHMSLPQVANFTLDSRAGYKKQLQKTKKNIKNMSENVVFPKCYMVKHTDSLGKFVNLYIATVRMESADRLKTHLIRFLLS